MNTDAERLDFLATHEDERIGLLIHEVETFTGPGLRPFKGDVMDAVLHNLPGLDRDMIDLQMVHGIEPSIPGY